MALPICIFNPTITFPKSLIAVLDIKIALNEKVRSEIIQDCVKNYFQTHEDIAVSVFSSVITEEEKSSYDDGQVGEYVYTVSFALGFVHVSQVDLAPVIFHHIKEDCEQWIECLEEALKTQQKENENIKHSVDYFNNCHLFSMTIANRSDYEKSQILKHIIETCARECPNTHRKYLPDLSFFQ